LTTDRAPSGGGRPRQLWSASELVIYGGHVGQTHDLVFDGAYVVKRYTSCDRGEHQREWDVLRHVAPHLPDVVPQPVEADLKATPPWISMSRLPGVPLSGRLPSTQLDALEQTLRQMWSVPVDALPPRRFHADEARSFLAQGLATARRPPGIVGEAYDVCLSHLTASTPWPGPPTFGHGDANLTNYLWDGTRVRVVDFEDAGVSHLEYELGCLVEHLSSTDTHWEPLLDRFATNRSRLRWARLTAAAQWLLLLLPGGPAAGRNPPDALDRQALRILTMA
jgi:aminoglycoside phosphotransferase